MRKLTQFEQHSVSGAGVYFDTLATCGAIIGGGVISPLAILMCLFLSEGPGANPQTAGAAFWAVVGVGAAGGGVLGGAVGGTIDYCMGEHPHWEH